MYQKAKSRQKTLTYFIVYAGVSVLVHAYFYRVVREWTEVKQSSLPTDQSDPLLSHQNIENHGDIEEESTALITGTSKV